MATDDYALGNDVQLQTAGGVITGAVFAFDKSAGVLVLKEVGAHSGVHNLRVLKASEVTAVLSSTKPATPYDTHLPYVDKDRCERRLEKAVASAVADAARVGVGVSREAQAVFDALVKTMPCTWRNKTIVVLDCVTVEEPYTEESCSGDAAHQATVERVRKVLNAERARLALA